MTGLPSAQSVRESLKRMIAQAGRRIAPLSAIVAEIDHLAEIKDLCGPAKRDELFLAAAQALAVTARESDFVGHHGSDRFVVLLPDTTEEGAATLAAKLRSAVTAIQIPGLERAVTASFGIAVFPRDGAAGESLLRAARARRAGGEDQGQQPHRDLQLDPKVRRATPRRSLADRGPAPRGLRSATSRRAGSAPGRARAGARARSDAA